MKITTLVPPAASAVSLEQARAFLRVDYGGEDDLLADFIAAATVRIEAETGLRLMPQTVQVDLDGWPKDAVCAGRLELPVRPLRMVSSIFADGEDVSGAFKQLADALPALAPLNAWPAADESVSITLEVGFATGSEIPADLLLAVRMLAADAYRQRDDEAGVSLSEEVARMIAPWRRVRV